mmetsp:Transcript_15265/g.43053  ORF Transcript_15265/g.43053 Transcript_15265/m.43053 type:complete len:145 (+) Transcript_15265:66-500(+)
MNTRNSDNNQGQKRGSLRSTGVSSRANNDDNDDGRNERVPTMSSSLTSMMDAARRHNGQFAATGTPTINATDYRNYDQMREAMDDIAITSSDNHEEEESNTRGGEGSVMSNRRDMVIKIIDTVLDLLNEDDDMMMFEDSYAPNQ